MGLIFQAPPRSEGIGREIVKTSASKPVPVYSMSGRLYKSESGWILLSVPNALVHGAFSALNEQGIELPPGQSTFNAHVTVLRPEELSQIPGGASTISERGKLFTYQLGEVKTVSPAGWKEMSKVWLISVRSPELEKFRKSYGLSARPKNNEFAFHITIAVRRKKVLQVGEVSKAAFTLPWLKTAKIYPFRPVNADPDFIRDNQVWHDAEKARLTKAAKKKREQPAGYIKETEAIKVRRIAAGSKPHKFQAAEWTHPNGHPRCKVCGDEETLDEQCPGYKSAADASPYWQRAVIAQLHSPVRVPGKGLLGNVAANLRQAHERGQRMVASQDIVKDMVSSQSTQAALARMQNYLSRGDFVTDPTDRMLFRPWPKF